MVRCRDFHPQLNVVLKPARIYASKIQIKKSVNIRYNCCSEDSENAYNLIACFLQIHYISIGEYFQPFHADIS